MRYKLTFTVCLRLDQKLNFDNGNVNENDKEETGLGSTITFNVSYAFKKFLCLHRKTTF